MMQTPWLWRSLQFVAHRLSGSSTFRGRARIVEGCGIAFLLVGLFLIWPPLGWLALGAGVVTYAQLMRR